MDRELYRNKIQASRGMVPWVMVEIVGLRATERHAAATRAIGTDSDGSWGQTHELVNKDRTLFSGA